MNSTPSDFACRSACTIICEKRSLSSARLGSPVSASNCARYASRVSLSMRCSPAESTLAAASRNLVSSGPNVLEPFARAQSAPREPLSPRTGTSSALRNSRAQLNGKGGSVAASSSTGSPRSSTCASGECGANVEIRPSRFGEL